MMQDWAWRCGGCQRLIESYESHDMENCYCTHGKEMPEDRSGPFGALIVFILIPLAIWLFFG